METEPRDIFAIFLKLYEQLANLNQPDGEGILTKQKLHAKKVEISKRIKIGGR